MGGQNRSSAVMQQRTEAHDSLDDFPTPPWSTRAVLAQLAARGYRFADLIVREPAANRGHMVKPLLEHFAEVRASDIFDYGCGFEVKDYLWGDEEEVDWTFTNPPFKLADQFIAQMLAHSRVGCAVIVRSAFLEGEDRYNELFVKNPPTMVFQHVERVVMHKAVLRRANSKYLDDEGNLKSASTATAYAWLVWVHGAPREPFDWIPPCRLQMERPGDYPPDPRAPVPPDDLFSNMAVDNNSVPAT